MSAGKDRPSTKQLERERRPRSKRLPQKRARPSDEQFTLLAHQSLPGDVSAETFSLHNKRQGLTLLKYRLVWWLIAVFSNDSI